MKYLSIKKDINSLEAQIKSLEDKNQNLIISLESVKSDFYKEREARLKFGLKQPGEKVVVIALGDNPEDNNSSTSNLDSLNPLQWWQYFFN